MQEVDNRGPLYEKLERIQQELNDVLVSKKQKTEQELLHEKLDGHLSHLEDHVRSQRRTSDQNVGRMFNQLTTDIIIAILLCIVMLMMMGAYFLYHYRNRVYFPTQKMINRIESKLCKFENTFEKKFNDKKDVNENM